MPPLKGIDRGLTGEVLKALEESGHGRRVAVVDASYNIPRWAQVVEYRGQRSADALLGIVRLTPVEGKVSLMAPDISEDSTPAYGAIRAFIDVRDEVEHELGNGWYHALYRTDKQEAEITASAARHAEEYPEIAEVFGNRTGEGFYTVANNQEEDTLFVRTQDTLPYACATFVVGHSQTAE